MGAREKLLASSEDEGDGKYKRACWMCEGGQLRIFVDSTTGKVLVEHGEPVCHGWLFSKLLADEYLADVRRYNGAKS
jgi:hypothetical protein